MMDACLSNFSLWLVCYHKSGIGRPGKGGHLPSAVGIFNAAQVH